MEVLTYKEKQIYIYIVKFKSINGFAPNVTEIAKACYTSRSYAREVLHNLHDKGFIKYGEGYRNIVVLKFVTGTA